MGVRLSFILLHRQGQQQVAPELVHSALKRALGMVGMIDEDAAVAFGDVPILPLAKIVMKTGSLVPQNVGKTALAVMPRFVAVLAPGSAAWRKLFFRKLVLDQPKAELTLPVAVGNGNI